ncbi:hypothetical protein [Paraburkholderia strydomiana]|uniref:hypothetical protein n=1 Tax=Paraburkholderia strydomiana TaxID=1245417 RepID=UPI00285C3DE0|nr:hypothetical protein [Paraburkholderia strydomiana]MDR7010037.1 hypothetical protein [Paraburkholderia strydomiana]
MNSYQLIGERCLRNADNFADYKSVGLSSLAHRIGRVFEPVSIVVALTRFAEVICQLSEWRLNKC